MDRARKFTILLFFLGLVSTSCSEPHSKNARTHCERIVKKWKSSTIEENIQVDKHTLRDLLFFLHVPRTGGRTYFHCFLRKLYPTALECPRSYDKLRFDPSKTNCRLLVTHDDYSLMTKLPSERTSVVTILRNPIDRVFSTYEFSIEVAARFLIHPNLTSATRMAERVRLKNNGVSTLDIWPWKYLVPWMRQDLFARRDARHRNGHNDFQSDDSYNMEEIVMPLHAYINDPVAQEIIHNGATFQVAGLTNNSYSVESHEVRHCVQKYQDLGSHVLDVAKKRLNNMLYVGLTEEHKESATMFANVVGSQVISQLIASVSSGQLKTGNESDVSSNFPDSEADNNNFVLNNSTGQKTSDSASSNKFSSTSENMTVPELMEAYETCISNLRKSQGRRRAASLKRISPANFSKEARRHVPEGLLKEIETLNGLDVQLYKHAQDIFAKQHQLAAQVLKQHQHTAQKLDNVVNNDEVSMVNRSYDYDASLWKIPLLVISIGLIFLILFLYVTAKRRASKLKI